MFTNPFVSVLDVPSSDSISVRISSSSIVSSDIPVSIRLLSMSSELIPKWTLTSSSLGLSHFSSRAANHEKHQIGMENTILQCKC